MKTIYSAVTSTRFVSILFYSHKITYRLLIKSLKLKVTEIGHKSHLLRDRGGRGVSDGNNESRPPRNLKLNHQGGSD